MSARRRAARRRGLVLSLSIACAVGLASCRCGERAPQRRSGPAVVVVDPDDVAPAVEEREPNDGPQQAQTLVEGEDVKATLGAADARGGDADWFAATVDQPRVLTAVASGVAGVDLVLEAFSTDGQRLVAVNNTGEGGGETLVNLAVDPGRYLLRVRERKGRATPPKSSYRVGYRLRDREEGEELEPNFKAAFATPLALGGEAIGYLGWHTDTDWYAVDISGRTPGALLRIEFDGVDGVAATLEVRDPDGNVLQQRKGGVGEPLALTSLAVPPTLSSIFVVLDTRRHFNVEYRYSLKVLAAVPSQPSEVEPNDVPATATPLTLGSPHLGILADGRDVDVFTINPSDPVTVVVAPPAGVDVALAQIDREGKVIWEVDAERAGKLERLPVVYLKPPGHFIRVRPPRGADTDPLATYRLAVTPRPGVWEMEPNDAPEQATRWAAPSREMSGFLHPDGDVDFFAIGGPAGVALQIRAEGSPPPVIAVHDETQAMVAAGGNAGSLTLVPQADKRYVLRVSGAPRAVKPYRIVIEPAAP